MVNYAAVLFEEEPMLAVNDGRAILLEDCAGGGGDCPDPEVCPDCPSCPDCDPRSYGGGVVTY